MNGQDSWGLLISEYLRIPVYLAQQRSLIEAKDSLQLVATLLLSVADHICQSWLDEDEFKRLKELEQKLFEIPYPGEPSRGGKAEERIRVSAEIIKLVIDAIRRSEERIEIILSDLEEVDMPTVREGDFEEEVEEMEDEEEEEDVQAEQINA